MKGQPGFFDLAERHEKHRKSAAGAKPWDVVVMFKVLILQQTYNLSDEQDTIQLITDA